MASAAAAATQRGSFDKAPFYDGKVPSGMRPVAHAAIVFHHEPANLDPTPAKSKALAALLDSVRAELDALGLTRPLAGVPAEGGPDVLFGCRRGGTNADGTPMMPDEIDTREPRKMAFEVEGPKRPWRDALRAAAGDARGVVSIQLRFGEQWVRQKNLKGSKTIELGTGRTMDVPWLTSLDDPVQVLQLTGALVTPEGKVTRVGAEGIGARRTGMTASVLGAQEVMTEEDLAALLAPGEGGVAPWRAALRTLVAGLIGRD
jgi:hypothetical protein